MWRKDRSDSLAGIRCLAVENRLEKEEEEQAGKLKLPRSFKGNNSRNFAIVKAAN